MAFDDAPAGERTEQPSVRRREEARRKGHVAKSPDLSGAVHLLAGLAVCSFAGSRLVVDAGEAVRRGLVAAARPELEPGDAVGLFLATTAAIVQLAWPFILLPAAGALAAQVLQTGFLTSWESVRPQWTRVDPRQGLARLLGPIGLGEAAKTLVKLGLLAAVAYAAFRAAWPSLLAPGDGEAALVTVGAAAARVWLAVGVAYLVLAGLDYGLRWWQHERSLRMTREEVREETREQEGNPLLRARIRALHRQRATRRMMSEVERADVVLRNPIHVAVALRYEAGKMRAPTVVAKGARLMARRIVAVAMRHGVPVIENPPLARSLYKLVQVGREIPAGLYRVVAEVLAHVYSLRERR